MVQRGWRWCARCETLWLADGHGAGVCAAGGGHTSDQSGEYVVLKHVEGAWPRADGGEGGWRVCVACRELHREGMNSCPAGGPHQSDPIEYAVPAGHQVPGQEGWRACQRCHAMVFAAQGGGPCPTGGMHDLTGSPEYVLSAAGPKIDFVPERDGFHFSNHYFENQVFPLVPGWHSVGRCGGMACAALDYWRWGVAIPTHRAPDFAPNSVPAQRLGDYIMDRLKNTLWNAAVWQFILLPGDWQTRRSGRWRRRSRS